MGVFHFKRFDIDDHGCGMKICSDSVLLAAWFLPPYRDARSVADVGAGSGILAMLAGTRAISRSPDTIFPTSSSAAVTMVNS